MRTCDICGKRISPKDIDKLGSVAISTWEFFFCREHYKEVSKVIKYY